MSPSKSRAGLLLSVTVTVTVALAATLEGCTSAEPAGGAVASGPAATGPAKPGPAQAAPAKPAQGQAGPASPAPAPAAATSRAAVGLESSYRLAKKDGKAITHMPAVLFSEDGKRLYTATSDGEVVVFDAATRAILDRRSLESAAIVALAVAPEGALSREGREGVSSSRAGAYVALLQGGKLEAVDPRTGKATGAVTGFPDSPQRGSGGALALTPDGRHAVVGNGDAIEVRALPALGLVKRAEDAHEGDVTGIAVSPDGRRLASVGRDGKLRLWSLPGLEPGLERSEEKPLYAVAFAPDGARIAYGGESNVVHEYDLRSGTDAVIASGQPFWITAAGYSPDGKSLAVGDESCDIWVFDVAARARLFHGKHHVECWLSSVAWAPDGRRFLFGCRPNAHDGTPSVFTPNVLVEALQSDGVQRLAAGARDEEARCWDDWRKPGDAEKEALRKSVREAIAKDLALGGGGARAARDAAALDAAALDAAALDAAALDAAALDAAERQWLTGGGAPAREPAKMRFRSMELFGGGGVSASDAALASGGGTLALSDPSYGTFSSGGAGASGMILSAGDADETIAAAVAMQSAAATQSLWMASESSVTDFKASRITLPNPDAPDAAARAAVRGDLAKLHERAVAAKALKERLAALEKARAETREGVKREMSALGEQFLLNEWRLEQK